jgi:hypothetical protein
MSCDSTVHPDCYSIPLQDEVVLYASEIVESLMNHWSTSMVVKDSSLIHRQIAANGGHPVL